MSGLVFEIKKLNGITYVRSRNFRLFLHLYDEAIDFSKTIRNLSFWDILEKIPWDMRFELKWIADEFENEKKIMEKIARERIKRFLLDASKHIKILSINQKTL